MNLARSPAGTSALIERFSAMSREELTALQIDRIRRQLKRLYQSSTFHRSKMDSAAVKPESIQSLADFAKMPTTNKRDLLDDQQVDPPYGSRLSVSPSSVAMINMTGGTSGQGQEIYGRTQHDIALQGYLHYLPWYLAGLRPGHIALNCVPQGGLTTGGWGPPEGFRVCGAAAINAPGTLGTDAKIDLMLRFSKLNFIYSSTNYLHTLTQALRRRGIEPKTAFPEMQGLFIAGEGYPRSWAENIVGAWGAPLHEGYGSTQGAGFIASTCEKSAVRQDGGPGHLHVFEWENYVELIDPDSGHPVHPGEEGEVVLTNLSVLGSPVIRFATGDKARLLDASSCGCGRHWRCIEAGSISRYDDMMKIRGNNLWPVTVDSVMFSEPDVAEYAGRVFVDPQGRTEVEIRYALKSGTTDQASTQALTDRLTLAIKDRTNVAMKLQAVARDQLPVFEYKARRWTDERKAGYAAAHRTGG
jgi:phenylacetate-CoA ligase